MTKQVYAIRHAKANKMKKSDDFSRKISKKGKKQCENLSTYIKNNKIKPDIVVCSPAIRCVQTWQKIKDECNCKNVVFYEKIYEANPKHLLSLLQSLDNDYNKVLLIGHNPALSTLCAALANTKKSKIQHLKDMLKRFPTGAMACLKTKAKRWAEIDADTLKLESFFKND